MEGFTIHDALEVNGKEKSSEIPERTLFLLQKNWNDDEELVIDEVNFLSPSQLCAINARL